MSMTKNNINSNNMNDATTCFMDSCSHGTGQLNSWIDYK